MDNITVLSILSACVVFLLGLVTWFLDRLIKQNDETHVANQEQFRELIDEVKEVRTALQEHKTDVLVIKEQINFHTDKFKDINQLYDRVRVVENDIITIKERRQQH